MEICLCGQCWFCLVPVGESGLVLSLRIIVPACGAHKVTCQHGEYRIPVGTVGYTAEDSRLSQVFLRFSVLLHQIQHLRHGDVCRDLVKVIHFVRRRGFKGFPGVWQTVGIMTCVENVDYVEQGRNLARWLVPALCNL